MIPKFYVANAHRSGRSHPLSCHQRMGASISEYLHPIPFDSENGKEVLYATRAYSTLNKIKCAPKQKQKVHRTSGTVLTMQRRREVREGEEVVKLPQLRRRVHGLLTAASAAGRRLPGRLGLGSLGRGCCRIGGSGLLVGLLRAKFGGAGDNVEQPPHVRDGELLRVVLCV